MNLNLRHRLTLIILAFSLALSLLLSIILISLSRSDLRHMAEIHQAALLDYAEAQILQDMELSARQLLDHLDDNLLPDSPALLVSSEYPTCITNADGRVLYKSTSQASTANLVMSPDERAEMLTLGILTRVDQARFEVVLPVVQQGELRGMVALSGDRQSMVSALIATQSELLVQSDQRVLLYSLIALGVVTGFVLVALLLGDQVSGYLTRPILSLRDHALAIGKSQFGPTERVVRDDEIGELAKAIYSMADDLEMQNQSVKFLAFHDPLTGLANRVNFQSQLETKLQEAEANRQVIALLFIDVDDFKEINDSRGHDVGDRALRMIADRLSRAVNAASSRFDHLHLARVDGDEFTIVVGDLSHNDQAARLAEDLLKRIAEPIVVDEQLFNISGSIGIALYPQDGETASSLLNNADAAMYRSKSLGKGTYRFYEPDMNNELYRSSVIKSEFKSALATPNQLELRYQPLMNLFSGEMIGAEALIRWHHPRLGPLPPYEFIAIVEHNEIALPTDLWVLERALQLLDRLDLAELPEFSLSINISASNLVRKQFTSSIQQIVESKAHVVQRIKLEITETFLHSDERQALETLQSLRSMGFAVWLDDFGTGYSSLNHLKTFPVEGIKIDQSFISNLPNSSNDQRMVSALLGLAHAFSVYVIAEGIDNQRSLEFLRAHGCRMGQGMLLGEPMTEAELRVAVQRLKAPPSPKQ